MAKRAAPEVNAGSMADIAFLLLIFFLVTTTIETDSGLNRKLPPMEDQVDPPIIREKNIFTDQAKESGKPDNIIEKMVEGRVEKFYAESCLLEQQFIKDPERKVVDLLTEAIATLGENIFINRFTRYAIGESSHNDNGQSQ